MPLYIKEHLQGVNGFNWEPVIKQELQRESIHLLLFVVLCSCQEYMASNVQTVGQAPVLAPLLLRQMESPVEELGLDSETCKPNLPNHHKKKLRLILRQYHMSQCPH